MDMKIYNYFNKDCHWYVKLAFCYLLAEISLPFINDFTCSVILNWFYQPGYNYDLSGFGVPTTLGGRDQQSLGNVPYSGKTFANLYCDVSIFQYLTNILVNCNLDYSVKKKKNSSKQ